MDNGKRPVEMEYERAKAMAVDPDPAVRAVLAARSDARPELLYYMADDDAPPVRRAIAANPATPVRACTRLARDRDEDVRVLLAGKLARTLPHLTAEEQSALHQVAVNALTMLAADQAVRVRAALASAIKDVDCAPPRLVAALARDVAREVAEPVLRTCALLSDEDLLSIISSHPEPWVLEAIARRPAVSAVVADAVLAEVGDDTSPAAIGNSHTPQQPDHPTRAEQGAPYPQSGQPRGQGASGRPTLPPEVTAKLAGFVEEEMRSALAESGAFDGETEEEIADVARRRLEFARCYAHREAPDARAARLYAAGTLGEEDVWDALSWGDRRFVHAALALLARIPTDLVLRILETQGPKAVTALAWRAGLSMRCARLLQHRAAGIHPKRVLNARLGTDYPLEEEEMRFQLSLFGIEG